MLMIDKTRLQFWLDHRGVDRATLWRLKIGWDRRDGSAGRYTIPVRDVSGRVVDVKRYRPGVAKYKNIHTKGFGSPCRIFGADRIARNDEQVPVYICAGEPDAIRLSVLGFLAVSATSGEGALPRPDDLRLLRGRKVRIIYDTDKAGRAGAEKLAMALMPIAREVRDVELPFAGEPGKDLTDWFAAGHTKTELIALVKRSPVVGGAGTQRPIASLIEWALATDLGKTGSRNATGFNLACQLRDEGYGRAQAEQVLLDQYMPAVTELKDEPYTVDEVRASIEQAYTEPQRRPSGLGPTKRNVLGRVLSRGELATLPKPEPLIAGWLDLRTSVVVVGDTGTNKTFTLLGWACSVATGVAWLDHKVCVDPLPVLVVVGEGGGGLDARISAWEGTSGVAVPDAMLTSFVQPESINEQEFWTEITIEALGRGARLVVLDTFSSLAPEADEVKDAAKVVRRMSDLAATIDGTVVLAHHSGWNNKFRSRGGSQFEANPDGVIVLSTLNEDDPDSVVSIVRKKDKDGPSGHKIHVQRVPVGESCVLDLIDSLPPGSERTLVDEWVDRHHDRLLETMRDYDAKGITRSDLAKAVGRTKAHVLKVIEVLIAQGELVVIEEPYNRADGRPSTVELLRLGGPMRVVRRTEGDGEKDEAELGRTTTSDDRKDGS